MKEKNKGKQEARGCIVIVAELHRIDQHAPHLDEGKTLVGPLTVDEMTLLQRDVYDRVWECSPDNELGDGWVTKGVEDMLGELAVELAEDRGLMIDPDEEVRWDILITETIMPQLEEKKKS